MKKLFFLILSLMSLLNASSLSFNLDSIAAMGKFPRFCINTYKWADRTFNSYDTTYIQSPGYKFNIKSKTTNWKDRYNFTFPNDYELILSSDMSISTGVHLSFMALSVGYNWNLTSVDGKNVNRNNFNFQFNCALFSIDLDWISNRGNTKITRFGEKRNTQKYNMTFNGINSDLVSVYAVYFLNNKKYSQSAAFSFGKIQKKSQGSFFFGVNLWWQNLDFDFSSLPEFMRVHLPQEWSSENYQYKSLARNYNFVVGYGFNWVFSPHWVLGLSEAPDFGLRSEYLNLENIKKYGFSLYNRFMASLCWNNRHWFAGGVIKIDNALVYDRNHSMINSVFNAEAVVGYRFNLW